MNQFSVGVRNGRLDSIQTTIGVSAKLLLFSGALPANCAAADPSGLLATLTLPSSWMAAASAGSKALAGVWTGNGSAAGVAACFRFKDNGATTCHIQGTVGQTVTINTSALTAANGNVLTFASTTGVVVGMNVSGTGIVPGTTVIAVTGTTVTLSTSSTAGVASATAITFTYDLPVDNPNIALNQVINVNTFTITDANA
jgi:hypothetical protein